FRGFSGRMGSAGWWGGRLFALALVGFLLSPALVGLGVLPVLTDSAWPFAAGVIIALLAMAAVLWAQSTMGSSWRVGVDATETTDLVTGGPFAYVRNPIFTAMILAALGFAVAAPTWLGALSLMALVIGIQLQVRFEEEPYLLATHGPAYRNYAARTGRFVPGLGRLTGGDQVVDAA
ncbi:methyltransferase family protein, partial [Tessaracoccus lubricantis]